MIKCIKKIAVFLLCFMILVCTTSCEKKEDKEYVINKNADATEFIACHVYDNTSPLSKYYYALEKEGPYRRSDAIEKKTLKIGTRKIDLVYFYTTHYNTRLMDFYYWEDDPSIIVQFYANTDSIYRIENQVGLDSFTIDALFNVMNYGDSLPSEEKYTQYCNDILKMLGYSVDEWTFSAKTEMQESADNLSSAGVNEGINFEGKEGNIPDDITVSWINDKYPFSIVLEFSSRSGRRICPYLKSIKFNYKIPTDGFKIEDEKLLEIVNERFNGKPLTLIPESVDSYYDVILDGQLILCVTYNYMYETDTRNGKFYLIPSYVEVPTFEK